MHFITAFQEQSPYKKTLRFKSFSESSEKKVCFHVTNFKLRMVEIVGLI